MVAQNWTDCRSSLHMGTPLRSLTVRCVSCGRSSGLVGPILVQTAVLCVVRARVWIWGHFRVQMAACSGRVARTQLPFGGVLSWRNRGVFRGPHDGTDGFGRRFWACSGLVLGVSQRRSSRVVGCFLGEIGEFLVVRTTVRMDWASFLGLFWARRSDAAPVWWGAFWAKSGRCRLWGASFCTPHDGRDGFRGRFGACLGRVAATQVAFGGGAVRKWPDFLDGHCRLGCLGFQAILAKRH